MNSPITTTKQSLPRPNVKFKSGMPESLRWETDIGKEIEPKFSVSFFQNKTDKRPSAREMAWTDFAEIFRKPAIRSNKNGPLFSPARFTKPHRLNENVDQLSMLLLDFDHDTDLIEALEVCGEMGVNYLIYTTHSHRRVTKSHPEPEDCFRVAFPLRESIPSEDFPYLFKWAEVIFNHKVDTSRKDLAGMFYLPAIYSPNSHYEFYAKTDGHFLDWKEPVREMRENDSAGLAKEERSNSGHSLSSGGEVGLARGDAPLRYATLRPPTPPRTGAVEMSVCVFSSASSLVEGEKEKLASYASTAPVTSIPSSIERENGNFTHTSSAPEKLPLGLSGKREETTQHLSSSAPVSRRRKSAGGASQKRLPLSLDSITYDPSEPFETWKAGLIVHISTHPLAKMNGQGKLDSPGLCHKSRIGRAVFCNLDANNITCTAGCSVTEVAKAYGYVPPPKSNEKEGEVSNSKPKDSNTVQTEDNGDEYFYHEPVKLKRKIRVVEGNKKGNNNNSKLRDESPEVPPKPTVKSLPVKWLKDVEEKETEWLMPGVPIGKVTLIGGDPKAGKSWVTFSWAAAVSNGKYEHLPGWTEREPGKVLIFSLENDCADTIRPRLRHLRAMMDNIGVIDTYVTLDAGSLPLIESTIAEVKPDLVIFDPITLYVGGDLDMNKANKVRQPMQRLQTLAAKFHCAVVVVAHLNKGSGGKSIYRVLGSVDDFGTMYRPPSAR